MEKAIVNKSIEAFYSREPKLIKNVRWKLFLKLPCTTSKIVSEYMNWFIHRTAMEIFFISSIFFSSGKYLFKVNNKNMIKRLSVKSLMLALNRHLPTR